MTQLCSSIRISGCTFQDLFYFRGKTLENPTLYALAPHLGAVASLRSFNG